MPGKARTAAGRPPDRPPASPTPARPAPPTPARPAPPTPARPAPPTPARRWPTVVAAIALLSVGAAAGHLWPSSTTHVEQVAALQQERAKSEGLARQLNRAWDELKLQAVALADSTAEKHELVELRAALSQQSDSYREALSQATERNRALERQLLARGDSQSDGGRNVPEVPAAKSMPKQDIPVAAKTAVSRASTNDKAVAPVAENPTPTPPPAPTPSPAPTPTMKADTELTRLMERAHSLLEQGNISGARIVLESAAQAGNPSAIFALAQTYDPAILSDWGTVGTQGDATKAVELYARAAAGGYRPEDDRLSGTRR